MNPQERQAVETLGLSQATWTEPELLDPSNDPFLINWEDMGPPQQDAASVLGYSQHDWEEDIDEFEANGDADDGAGASGRSGEHQVADSEAAERRKREMLAKFAVRQSDSKATDSDPKAT